MTFPIEVDTLEQVVRTYTFGLPRIYLVFTILPVLSKKMLGGAMIRNGVILSLALFLYPINEATMPVKIDVAGYVALFLKEILLGIVMGFIATVPFWAAQGVGFLIDNQRGAAMASLVNPMLGEQTSPLGLFIAQVMITIFVISGALLVLIFATVQSYTVWPVGILYPEFFDGLDTFALTQLDLIMKTIVVLAAPVVLAMFLAEFALGLVSRFAPQMNVFFLAMPVKSAIAFFVLVIYMKLLVANLSDFIHSAPDEILDLLTSAF